MLKNNILFFLVFFWRSHLFACHLDMLLATPAPEASNPRQGHGAFDTYRFVTELERAGVPKGQAVMIMEQVLLAISEANTRQIALVREGGVV